MLCGSCHFITNSKEVSALSKFPSSALPVSVQTTCRYPDSCYGAVIPLFLLSFSSPQTLLPKVQVPFSCDSAQNPCNGSPPFLGMTSGLWDIHGLPSLGISVTWTLLHQSQFMLSPYNVPCYSLPRSLLSLFPFPRMPASSFPFKT